MRQLTLKTVLNDDGQTMLYQDLLVNTLKTHPQGMGLDEMERVLRIVKLIRDSSQSVLLEEADYEYVVKRLTGAPWVRADSALVQFIKEVRDAPKFDPNALLKETAAP